GVAVPARAELRWGFPGQGQPAVMSFSRKMFLKLEEEPNEPVSRQRLNNLGYPTNDKDKTSSVRAFQEDFGHLAEPWLDADGQLDVPTMNLIKSVYDAACDDLRNNA